MTSLGCREAFVALASFRFEILVDYYQSLLGQEPAELRPGIYAEFQISGLRLGIFCPKADQAAAFNGPAGPMSLCLEVMDLAEALTHLHSLGYSVEMPIQQASHGWEVLIYDPDGNRLILHQAFPANDG